MKRGFTVVEVLITLVVIAILLGLGTVGLRSTLANGRDSERKADIESIARALEIRYDKGNNYSYQDGSNTVNVVRAKGSYPGSWEIIDVLGYGYQASRVGTEGMLPGLPKAAYTSPSGETLHGDCILMLFDMPFCDKAEKPAVIERFFSNGSGGYRDRYMYEFIGPEGGYCANDDCVRYNLYWISEADKSLLPGYSIPGLKVYRSKHT